MKAVNLTVNEKTWRAARKLAAERDTSVSALAGEALQNLIKAFDRRKKARRRILKMIGSFGGKVGALPGRAECYARC
jgi:hypothetical protein